MVARLVLAAAMLAFAAPGGAAGLLKTVMESPASLPTHTVYRPAAIGSRARLPLVVFANGGCANLGNNYAELLGNIAAHGYLVVAIGPIGEVAPLTPRPPGAGTPAEGLAARVAASANKLPPSTAKQLSDAVDWAVAQNRSGPLAGRIDIARVAAIGHSCGGLQAIAASAADARISTTVLLNSGVFTQPAVAVDKAALDRLHGPIAYFIGGAGDMAYPNAEDDFARISRVPVLKANSSFGHGGRLRENGGGPTAAWVVRWLDWRLKGDRAARSAFAGPNCGLCRAPGWMVARKGLD